MTVGDETGEEGEEGEEEDGREEEEGEKWKLKEKTTIIDLIIASVYSIIRLQDLRSKTPW